MARKTTEVATEAQAKKEAIAKLNEAFGKRVRTRAGYSGTVKAWLLSTGTREGVEYPQEITITEVDGLLQLTANEQGNFDDMERNPIAEFPMSHVDKTIKLGKMIVRTRKQMLKLLPHA
jgi:hypothetical protein